MLNQNNLKEYISVNRNSIGSLKKLHGFPLPRNCYYFLKDGIPPKDPVRICVEDERIVRIRVYKGRGFDPIKGIFNPPIIDTCDGNDDKYTEIIRALKDERFEDAINMIKVIAIASPNLGNIQKQN
jgi:hypothetical protein